MSLSPSANFSFNSENSIVILFGSDEGFGRFPSWILPENITLGDEGTLVQKGNMKFSTTIKNWGFCGQGGVASCTQNQVGEFLDFSIIIKGKGTPKKKSNALFVFVMCIVSHMLPVSLNCPFMIAPPVFSNVFDCPFGFL
jgi:hypothetical protein